MEVAQKVVGFSGCTELRSGGQMAFTAAYSRSGDRPLQGAAMRAPVFQLLNPQATLNEAPQLHQVGQAFGLSLHKAQSTGNNGGRLQG